MTKKTGVSIFKPNLVAAALEFADGGAQPAAVAISEVVHGSGRAKTEKRLRTGAKQVSGLVPEGDVRLTANISENHHVKLKVAAAQRRTTIGELIEQLIDKELHIA